MQKFPPWALLIAVLAAISIGRLTFVQESTPLSLDQDTYSTSETSGLSSLARGELLNINDATSEELNIVPSLGPKKAAAIINHREIHGCFHNLEDLGQIRGIGPKTIEKWRPYLKADGCTE